MYKIKKKELKKIITEIKKNGYVCLPKVYKKSFCKKIIKKLEIILKKIKSKNKYYGSNKNQVIYNYFYYDLNLIKLAHNSIIDKIMKELIDDDYVLISPSARNPRIINKNEDHKKTTGFGWHVDSRVIGQKSNSLIKPSISYFAIIALEDFTKFNASTKYVERSHKLYKKPKNREIKIKSKNMIAKAGSIIFFDTALWHRVGEPTKISRWSIFNMYGPWYMKPYFRFTDGLSQKKIKKLSRHQKKILHFNSIPPVNSDNGIRTLKKI